jgi:hypothetical protein
LTPVPIRIDLPRDVPAHRVLVHYRLFGTVGWTTLELRRRDKGWAGAIPCIEVSTVTGDLVYYIRIHDRDGAVVAYSGSRHRPYRVRIVHPSERRGIAANKCPDPSDCPPGLLGCPSERLTRVPCSSDSDCEGGMTCGWDGFCEVVERELNWLELGVEQGAGIVSTTGACSVPSQESEGYACYRRSDGDIYAGDPVYTNEPLRVGLAPTRVLVGYDRVLFYGTSIGLRIGYALVGEGPTLPQGTPFFPLSVELRAAHWFGRDPFAVTGVRPYVYTILGAGMFDISFPVHVRERPTTNINYQGGNDLEQTLDGHKRAGDVFVGAGAGMMWALTRQSGPAAELGVVQVFPTSATVFLPRISYRVGF